MALLPEPRSRSKIWNTLGDISRQPALGGMPTELLRDSVVCPPALPESKESWGSQAMAACLLVHIASTAQAGMPQPRADTGPREGSGPPHSDAASRGGEGLRAMSSPTPCISQAPDLIHDTETADHTAPRGYKRGDQLSPLPLTETWPCWPAAPSVLHHSNRVVTMEAVLLHLTSPPSSPNK